MEPEKNFEELIHPIEDVKAGITTKKLSEAEMAALMDQLRKESFRIKVVVDKKECI